MYYIATKNDTNYLIHHGVKGMHWGIRRYQNPDGTLTSEGRAKYRSNSKFKSKVDSYKRKDEFMSEGHSKFVANRADKYIKRGLTKKEAIDKAEYDAKTIKKGAKIAAITLGSIGTVAVGAAVVGPSIMAGNPGPTLKLAIGMASKGLLTSSMSSLQNRFDDNGAGFRSNYEKFITKASDALTNSESRELSNTFNSLSEAQKAGFYDFMATISQHQK